MLIKRLRMIWRTAPAPDVECRRVFFRRRRSQEFLLAELSANAFARSHAAPCLRSSRPLRHSVVAVTKAGCCYFMRAAVSSATAVVMSRPQIELVMNLKTAKALSLTIPPGVLAAAAGYLGKCRQCDDVQAQLRLHPRHRAGRGHRSRAPSHGGPPVGSGQDRCGAHSALALRRARHKRSSKG
jgi:hypothetical protein